MGEVFFFHFLGLSSSTVAGVFNFGFYVFVVEWAMGVQRSEL